MPSNSPATLRQLHGGNIDRKLRWLKVSLFLCVLSFRSLLESAVALLEYVSKLINMQYISELGLGISLFTF